ISVTKRLSILDSLEGTSGNAKGGDVRVQKIRMAGVDPAFDGLEIIRLLKALGNVAMALRHARPFQLGQLGLLLPRAQIGPDQAAILTRRVSRGAQLVAEAVRRGLVGHVDVGAVYVEFPAVCSAGSTAFMIARPRTDRLA